MQTEILARVADLNDDQIALQVCRMPCAGCDGRCGVFLSGSQDERPVSLSRPYFQTNSESFDVGNTVSVGVPVKTLIGLSSLVYLVPLVLMLLSAVVCSGVFSQSDVATAIGAGFGLIGGLLFVRFQLSRFEKNQASETLFIRHEILGL